MIKELRRKFTIVAMYSMFLVLAVIMGIFHIVSYLHMTDDADHLTAMIANNGGTFPAPFNVEEPSDRPEAKPKPSLKDVKQEKEISKDKKSGSYRMSPETPYETRYFSVIFDKDGNVSAAELRSIAAVSDATAEDYAKKVRESRRKKGFIDIYRYRFVEKDTGGLAIFLDCRSELESFWSGLIIMSCVSAAGLLAVFALVVAFSNIVFRPVAESYQKQKQFITDASHEIKTPLTIIDANAEVIEMENGESAWTKSIRNQVKRLTALTQQMITLSRLDEGSGSIQREYFLLTDIVKESAEPFEILAERKGKNLTSNIEREIYISGVKTDISQLVGILLDNAIKYSIPESDIELSLTQRGKKVYLRVCNQAAELPKGNLNILFERFYTMDHSRNSEISGSGIGLSIARAIVLSHKGKIIARSMDGKSIEITAEWKAAGKQK